MIFEVVAIASNYNKLEGQVEITSLSLFSPGRDKGIQKGLECPAGVHEPPFEPPMQWRLANDQRLQTILYFYP